MVFLILVIVGVLTVSSGSPPASNTSHVVRATTAAGPASAPAVVHSPTPAPSATAPPSAPGTFQRTAAAPAPAQTSPAPARTPAARATTRAGSPPVTQAAPPPPSATEAGPAAPTTCRPKTDGGKCYEPGEFCRDSDHGANGVAGDGKVIRCEDNDGWRWEPI